MGIYCHVTGCNDCRMTSAGIVESKHPASVYGHIPVFTAHRLDSGLVGTTITPIPTDVEGGLKKMTTPQDKADEEFEGYVRATFEQSLEVLLSKHKDYGPKNIADAPGGALNGLRVRMHDKLARVNNLLDSGATPENESLRDSFLDLMNYAAIAQLVLDGHWPER